MDELLEAMKSYNNLTYGEKAIGIRFVTYDDGSCSFELLRDRISDIYPSVKEAIAWLVEETAKISKLEK